MTVRRWRITVECENKPVTEPEVFTKHVVITVESRYQLDKALAEWAGKSYVKAEAEEEADVKWATPTG